MDSLLLASLLNMFLTELLAPHCGCNLSVRTARCLVTAQVALVIIFFGLFGLVFSSMEAEVELTVACDRGCELPIVKWSMPSKVAAAFAFGFLMNTLLPVAT